MSAPDWGQWLAFHTIHIAQSMPSEVALFLKVIIYPGECSTNRSIVDRIGLVVSHKILKVVLACER